MDIFSFDKFIVEKLGISLPSLIFVDFLDKRCLEIFIEFMENKSIDSLNNKDNINYNQIKTYIKNPKLYQEFPVVGFEIIYDFQKFDDNNFIKNFPKISTQSIMSVGGWASGFGNKNWKNYSKIVNPVKKYTNKGLIIQIGIIIYINKDKFNYKDSLKELKENISSTFYHELNHSFESYKRTINGDKKKAIYNRSYKTSVTYASENYLNFPKNIFTFWYEKFLKYTYISEKFELRSHVQEMYYYLKEYPEKDIKEFTIYKYADYMEKFDPQLFYDKLIIEIGNHKKYKGQELDISQEIKNMWILSYQKHLNNQNATPIISINKLKKMTCLEFIKWWGKQFNINGTYLKKKIYKIKSGLNHGEI